jgi:hypothetical protein
MTVAVTITLCALLLLAYVFDLSASRTRIPTVILLLALGWLVRQSATFFQIPIPNLDPILPALGTVGLILIVLEGSLELELNRSRFGLVAKASFMALLPMLLLCAGIAALFMFQSDAGWQPALANAIPLAVISSAIAIPTAQFLRRNQREFITYESSLSDIYGVILFNFITLNNYFGAGTFGIFLLQMMLMLVISFLATAGLSFLMSRSRHKVKFIPIMIILILIYSLSKIWHLPALVFILLFGLFLGNLDQMVGLKFIQRLRPERLEREVHRFTEITAEVTFLIRSLFFLLFGFLIETSELLNPDSLIAAVTITAAIFLTRYLSLLILRIPPWPVLFIAPRGLITILLFLSVPVALQLNVADRSLIIQVIVLCALVMMFGMMAAKPEKPGDSLPRPEDQSPLNMHQPSN